MNPTIYLDNASTSFPKAPGVADAVSHYISQVGCNISRGEYAGAYSAAEVVMETREMLSRLFSFSKIQNVIFTANVTHSLNIIIKGLLKPGDHVLVSAMEHNAVMRPLVQMQGSDVSFTRIPCSPKGELLLNEIPALVRPQTKAIIMLHASNVCGTVMPIAEVGMLAKQYGLLFCLDAAQTAGVFDIDMQAMQIDALAVTGHKSLLGPQGIGSLVFSDRAATICAPLTSGGTGSMSDSEEIPRHLPDRFEAGTANLPGIFGLHAALCYLKATGIASIREREQTLAKRLHDQLAEIPDVRLPGVSDWRNRAPIVSADFSGIDNALLSYQLAEKHRISTRCGLHCAPNAHRTLGTFPQGTVRFSVSHFNTTEEIDTCAQAVKQTVYCLRDKTAPILG